MTKRFSWAFLAGGILTSLVLWGLQLYARAIEGMSAGIGANAPETLDTIAIVLICLYFFVSAFGVFVSKTKRELRIWASATHAMALIAYLLLFVSTTSSDTDGTTWRGAVTKLGLIMAAYFLPWVCVWLRVLTLNPSGAQSSQP